MKLQDAALCLDCGEVYGLTRFLPLVESATPAAPLMNGSAQTQGCPACGSQTFWPLERFVTRARDLHQLARDAYE